jgi:prophage regulatory protein
MLSEQPFAAMTPHEFGVHMAHAPFVPLVELVDAKPVLRRAQLRAIVPLADTTIYEMEQRGDFPKRFYLTPRCPVWDLGAVNSWIAARREEAGSISPPHPDVRRRKTRPVRV